MPCGSSPPELPFQIRFIEITEPEQTLELNGYRLRAFRVNHNVLCYGYTLEVDRAGRFDVGEGQGGRYPAAVLEHPSEGGSRWSTRGGSSRRIWCSDPPGKGLKVTYCTDTRPTDSIRNNARGSDPLSYARGMYGEKDKLKKAKEYKHMTFYEAARLAKEAEVGELWLTHYSPSLNHPEEFLEDARAIFPRTVTARDGRTMELVFSEDE